MARPSRRNSPSRDGVAPLPVAGAARSRRVGAYDQRLLLRSLTDMLCELLEREFPPAAKS